MFLEGFSQVANGAEFCRLLPLIKKIVEMTELFNSSRWLVRMVKLGRYA